MTEQNEQQQVKQPEKPVSDKEQVEQKRAPAHNKKPAAPHGNKAGRPHDNK